MAFSINPYAGSAHPFTVARKPSRDTVIAGIVCSIGGTVFGYDLGALSAVSRNLRSQFSLSPSSFGLTISASLWGTVLGSIVAGYLVLLMGRRGLIALCALAYALASVGLATFGTDSWELLLVLRFVCGFAIGGFTVGCPLYLAEIAPSEQRGRFVTWFQIQVGGGVVLGFAIGYIFTRLVPVAVYWQACFGFGAIPAIVLLLCLRQMPPEWNLADHTRKRQALVTLEYFPASEFIISTSHGTGGDGKLFCRKNLRPLLIATSIAVFNQLSGINILLLYLLDVLSDAGADFIQSHRYTLLIAGVGSGTTIFAMTLVDKIGRKPLLISGAAGMSICLFILSSTLLHHMSILECLIILITYNICFSFSFGTVIWVYLSELFPFEVRAKGQSYGASVHWIVNAILIAIFPTLEHFSPEWSFRFLGFMMLLQIVVAMVWYPETKGIRIRPESKDNQSNLPSS